MATKPTTTRTTKVAAAPDNRRADNHTVCLTCHPEPALGDPALCGEPVLGIEPDPYADMCGACAHFRLMKYSYGVPYTCESEHPV